jgi:hypothetical protein
MSDAIEKERVESGIGENNLPHVPGGRIPIKNDLDVFFQSFQHNRRFQEGLEYWSSGVLPVAPKLHHSITPVPLSPMPGIFV